MAGSEQIVADVTAAIVQADPRPEAIVTAVVETLTRARPAMWVATILSRDPTTVRVIGRDDRNSEVSPYINTWQRASGFTVAPLASRVIETGDPLVIPRITWSEYADRYLDKRTRNHMEANPFPADMAELSGLVVPMRATGAIIGSLAMILRQTPETASEGDLEWLEPVANQTGLAVQNAQLSAEAKSRLDEVDAVHAMVDAIRSSQDPVVALKIIVYRVTAILGVDACDVLLIDEANDTLFVGAASGFAATSVPDFRLPLDNPLIRQGLASRRIEDLRSASILDEARRRSLFAREGFRSYAVFPLTSHGRWLGALEVFHRTDLKPDAEWFQFLDTMAGMASLAIDSAKIQEQLLGQSRMRKTVAVPNLSAIETQILKLLVEGMTNREIAAHVHLSQSTIKFHVRQILDKTGASNRTDLTRRATREGWV